MSSIYDIGIVGSGPAGTFAALRLAEHFPKKKCVLFELGRPVSKRRRQIEGFFGCLLFGDGKLYPDDTKQIADIVDAKRLNQMSKWTWQQFEAINKSKLIKNKIPSNGIQKKMKDKGFELSTHDYYQWKPDSIHQLSKNVADRIETVQNVEFSFDNEVYNIQKSGDVFHVSTLNGEFICSKLILCAGRSGWRWVNKLYKDLGILVSDDIVKYGVKIEMPSQYMKDFNKSHCSFISKDIALGPFSWGGQVIQEDHADMTIASFRSNEDRWKSDKVFFSMIINKEARGEACYQTDRLAKLAFLLSQDRVGREKIKSFIKGESQLSLIPEYNILKEYFEYIDKIIPTIISRGYFHCPDIYSLTSNIRVAPNLETEIEGLFVAGESAGFRGIYASAVSGAIAAEGICK